MCGGEGVQSVAKMNAFIFNCNFINQIKLETRSCTQVNEEPVSCLTTKLRLPPQTQTLMNWSAKHLHGTHRNKYGNSLRNISEPECHGCGGALRNTPHVKCCEGVMAVVYGTPLWYQCPGDDPVCDISIVINVVMIAALAFRRLPSIL
ncbi:hypothetical protein E2C01_020546 [Portunus trituberculatus]|uniref:Uncharacterized protein n=1 Tax=Portunus trituberculatus TaxID=210409 RepID=A0A5B7E207_PORTR|nr:hypothetical protein [Portunus trituberculatus]